MHNMADDVTIANHLTTRGGVYQYVRRVPKDLRSAFAFERVQKSLGTRNARAAREMALELDRDWERRFGMEREKLGAAPAVPDDEAPRLSTADWIWPDWEALARWLELTLAEEDWRIRCARAPGRLLVPNADLRDIPWREDAVTREHIDRRARLETLQPAAYAQDRLAFLQRYVSRLGVALDRANPYFERFMLACQAAELAYLDLYFTREARKGGTGNAHPDTVEGPWRKKTSAADEARSPQPAGAESRAGKTLEDCVAKWISRREFAKKNVNAAYIKEMRNSVSAFCAMTGITDVGAIQRRDVIRYRDALEATGQFAVASINKKVGFITTLIDTALHAAWREIGVGNEIFLPLPSDENRREPYSGEQLSQIFRHPIFTQGYRFDRKKAGGELQFWLPLIACCQGMSSSEILQLGPDTVRPHDEHPDILCFAVTNAGERATKTLARRRWVPVRRELVDLGLVDLVRQARDREQSFLWSAMNQPGADRTRISGYFSSFWAGISAKEFGICDEETSLYSFRHAFQDALGRAGYGAEIKKALMGHSDGGMTSRYGTKKMPKPVPILTLNEAVQGLTWPFIAGLQRRSVRG